MSFGEDSFSGENNESEKNEVEAKVLNIDQPSIENRLVETGAQRIFKGEIVNIIFDTADGRLKKLGYSARVRQITPMRFDDESKMWVPLKSHFVWTIKGRAAPDTPNKKRPEWPSPNQYETESQALPQLQKKAMELFQIDEPLVEVRRVTKERASYLYADDAENENLRDVQVDIDTISSVTVRGQKPKGVTFPLPTSLEIEPNSEEGADEKIKACADELGLELDSEQRQWSEADVLRHYGIKPK